MLNPKFEGILQNVERTFNVTREDLIAPSRGSANVAFVRQVAMHQCWLLEPNFTEVGRLFGRDRTTIRHAVNKIGKL